MTDFNENSNFIVSMDKTSSTVTATVINTCVADSSTKEKESKELDDLSKENSPTNKCFMFLIFICYVGSFVMISSYEKYWNSRIHFKPQNYEIPKLSDLRFLLINLPVLVFLKLVFEQCFQGFMYRFLSQKYKNPSDEENFNLGHVYKKKLAMNLFKLFYYSGTVIIGHFILKDMCFFPKELLGNGNMLEMFKDGVPGYLFFDKPLYFNELYLTGLAFVITDLIWLLFIYERQSDFYLMLLHHSITISLVLFSYLTNLSQVGIIVFYLHDASDIFVYITRIVINTDYRDCIKLTPCALLLLSFIVFRVFVFGKLIIYVALYMNDWNPYTMILWSFKCILLMMNVFWIIQIIRRFLVLRIEDVGKVKKK